MGDALKSSAGVAMVATLEWEQFLWRWGEGGGGGVLM